MIRVALRPADALHRRSSEPRTGLVRGLILLLPIGCVGGEQAWSKGAETPTAPSKPAETATGECPGGLVPASDGNIDDFEDGDNAGAREGGREGYWYTAKDSLGSQFEIPAGDFETAEGGADGSTTSIHIKGTTSAAQDDQAWGIELGMAFRPGDELYDASKYQGFSFKAKVGSPDAEKKVRVSLSDANTHPSAGVCKNCYNHFNKELSVSEEWQEYTIAFADMKQRPYWGDPRPDGLASDQLYGINFQIGGGKPFDFWVDDIRFLACKQ